jgi:hypothetical protein
VGLDRSAVSRIVQNTKISEMHNLLSKGRDMDYVASHYHMDLALARQTYGGLARALRLEGKNDLDRFKAPNSGLRTWDLWNRTLGVVRRSLIIGIKK